MPQNATPQISTMSEQYSNSKVGDIVVDISDSKLEYDTQTALKKACDLIAKFEGCKLESYKCPAGIWTIGYGHTFGVKSGDIISQSQAEDFLMNDVRTFFNFVIVEVSKICNESQLIALTSFAFNVGVENLRKSTLLKVVKQNPRNFTAIRKEFMRWVYADGKILNGLKKRRSAEADFFEGKS